MSQEDHSSRKPQALSGVYNYGSTGQYNVNVLTLAKALGYNTTLDPIISKTLGQIIPAMRNDFYDENASNGGSCPYYRVTTRVAPHNEFTTTDKLIACLTARGYHR